MTVSATISEAYFYYTGAQVSFAAGFRARQTTDIQATLTSPTGIITPLIQGVHYAVSLAAGSGLATVTRILFPSPAGVLRIWRESDYLQPTTFPPGEAVPSQAHEDLHDAHVLRMQEIRRDADQALTLAGNPLGVSVEKLDIASTNVFPALSQGFSGGVFILFINGAAFAMTGPSPAFAAAGKTITWLSTLFSVNPGDEVIAFYSCDGNRLGVIAEKLNIATLNTLPQLSQTFSGGVFMLFVNGATFVMAGLSPPFSVSGTTITWLSPLYSVTPGDEVVAFYSFVR